MAKEPLNPDDVVLAEEIGHVSLITLNRPRQLNVISLRVVELVAKYLEEWEKDANSKLVIFKGAGRAFSAGGDLKMFYAGRSADCCLEVVYRMYWLCYHIHTYKKTMVALIHGIVMGGGGVMTVPLKFSVVTEKTIFSMPEASIGLHSDCSFSYILPRLPGFLGDENAVRNAIENFSIDVLSEETILNKLQTINKCFCKGSLEEIVESFEAEARNDGNEWIWPVLKGFKGASPTGLKITLRSIREGRTQTLSECLKKEFKITMNLLTSVVSNDVYEGIRSFSIDKDNAPKWNPATFGEVSNEKVELAFKSFNAELELKIADDKEAHRWGRKYEEYVYSHL